MTIPPPLGCDPTDLYIRKIPLHDHLVHWSVSNIVVSCLVTIFACTWTAIHPNIPSPCDSGWEKFKRKVTTTIYAILAPEMITAWALRQHLAARRIAKKYNKVSEDIDDRSWIVRVIAGIQVWFSGEPLQDVIRWLYREPLESVKGWFRRHPVPRVAKEGEVVTWTITHGFFQQMGGFMLCDDRKPIKVIESVREEVLMGSISAPMITKGQIEDHSKGDGVTKAVVVLQMTWFIAQCIVCWSSSLPVTELEVLTLGFATLNGITYALWWYKPQSVRLLVYLEKKGTAGSTMEERRVIDRQQNQAWDGDSGTWMVVAPEKVEVTAGEDETRGQGADERKSQVAGRAWTAVDPPPPAKRSQLSKDLEKSLSNGWNMILMIPFYLISAVFLPLIKMIDPSNVSVEEGQLRVPMFHSADADSATVAVASSVIASIFGLIHFIPAFFLDFPSRPEMVLWRMSAGIIAVQPLFTLVLFTNTQDPTIIGFFLALSKLLAAFFGLPLYIIARIALIILAFLSVRTVQGDALITVDWISFIPHF